MKVVYLFNKVRTGTDQIEHIRKGIAQDNSFFGMFRIRQYGIESDFLEVEQYLPRWVTRLLRKVLNIWWIHVPLYPLLFKYDLVCTSTAYGSLFVHALLRSIGIKRPRWVLIDFNVTGTIGDVTTLRQKLFKWAVSKADGIVAISEAERKALGDMFPHLRERIVFFYEGVDTNFYKPSRTLRTEENIVLSVGLDPSRDFATLVEAVRGLGDVDVRMATKPERVAHIELPAHVEAQLYSHTELRDLYQRAALIVIGLNMKADNNDSMGTFAVIEAMSMEKAVIVTKTTSMESYIEDGVTGIFVPVHDADALRAAIETWMPKVHERKEMGKRAREFVVTHADAEVFAQHLADFFKRIMMHT